MKFSDDQIQQLTDVIDERFEVKLKEHLKKELAPIQRTLRSMKKDLNYVIGKYDLRLNHLEKHAIHPPGRADN